MAITHVNSAASGATDNTTSLTITIPAEARTDDLLFCAFTNRDATDVPTVTDDDTTGRVWAQLQVGDNGTSGASVWWKRATSATAGKTITASGFTGSCAGGVHVIRGGSRRATPFVGQTYETNASGNETSAGFTPTVNGCWVVLCVFNGTNDLASSNQAATNPSALTERFDHLNTGGSDCQCSLASDAQTGLASATGNITWSQTNAASMSIVFGVLPELPVQFTNYMRVRVAGGSALTATH